MTELKMAVFLFTDIEQSTQLWEHDELAMQTALTRHDEILRAAIRSHDGTVFSTAGDSISAVFMSARSALDAALDAQTALLAEQWPTSNPLRVRMGLHVGEAQARGGDWFGTTVNRTARIMSLAHGGQIVVSNVLVKAVGRLLPDDARLIDLGRHELKGLGGEEHLWQIVAPGLIEEFPPLSSLGAVTGVPAQLTSLIGRDDDVVALTTLGATVRLLTLTGPGGIGKTRLAIEMASLAANTSRDGRWFVDLAPLRDPGGVDVVVSATLGLVGSGARRETILDAIGQRDVLLILDNAEHVLDAVRDLCAAILQRCRAVRIIVTSREPLGLSGEQIWPVRSLEAESAAVLFVDRAHAVRPDVIASSAAVDRICERLDGIPMAIELAAARTRTMSVSEIATRLAESFELLTRGRHGTLERHQTMRAAIDWSYQLLADDERVLFRRLAVFAGGFDATAATAVAGFSPLAAGEIVDILDELAAKSMILADVGEATTRFRVLEPLRQFASEQLGPEWSDVSCRHALYYTMLAEQRGGWSIDGAGVELLAAEFDNLRAAVNHALATADVDTALRLTTPLHSLWNWFDLSEAGLWVGAAADLEGSDGHPLGTTAHGQAAHAATLRVDVGAREHHLSRGGPSYWEALARAFTGSGPVEKLAAAHRALEHARGLPPVSIATVDVHIIVSSLALGESCDDSMARVRRLAETNPEAGLEILRMVEAAVAFGKGDHAAALAAYDALLASYPPTGRRPMGYYYVQVLRLLLVFRHDQQTALNDARSFLVEARNIGARTWVDCALSRTAVMLAAVGRETAAAVLQAYTRDPPGGTVMADGDPGEHIAYNSLTDAQLAAAATAHRLDFDGAIQLALDELDFVVTRHASSDG